MKNLKKIKLIKGKGSKPNPKPKTNNEYGYKMSKLILNKATDPKTGKVSTRKARKLATATNKLGADPNLRAKLATVTNLFAQKTGENLTTKLSNPKVVLLNGGIQDDGDNGPLDDDTEEDRKLV